MKAAEAVERGLLEHYAPVLRYHPQEPYRADSPATMTDAAIDGSRGTRLIDAEGDLVASALGVAGVDKLRLDFLGEKYAGDDTAARAKDRLVPAPGTAERDSREMHRRPLLGDRVYAHAVQEDGGRVWLQYWLFYYFNDKSLAGIGDHEGDWEMIQIGLDRGGHPELATFAQHKGGERRPWKQVETLDDAPDAPPVVYVALGSHASYFQTGNYWLRPFPLADHAVDGPQVRPTVERLDGSRWVHWPGRWGSGEAPRGPKQHRQFAAPESWHGGSSVHGRRRVRIGRTFLVERDAELPPPVRLDAVLAGDAVTVAWEVAELDPLDPRVPVRILLSVRRADPAGVPITRTRGILTPEGSDQLPVPPGGGGLVVAATVFDARDAASVPVESAVREAEPPGRGARARGMGPGGPAPRAASPRLRSDAPARAAAAVRLLVRVDDEDPGASETLREAVRDALGSDALGAPWQIDPLFPRGAGLPDRLAPFFTVTGRLAETPAYPLTAAAFDVARELAERTGYDVHPDLPSGVFERPPRPRRGRAAAGERGAPDAEWPLRELRLRDAWTLEPTRGAGVRIAQPDTGITAHEALPLTQLDLLNDIDVIDGDDDATDPLERRWWRLIQNPGHGTATASVIIGPGPKAPCGAAPGATLIPVRCMTGVVQVLDGDVAVAIECARRLDVDVITMSLGGEGFFPALREAVAAAVADGIIVLAAGGNYAPFVPAPARYPECLAVAATDSAGRPWEHSSPGREIDWAAPGEGVAVARARRSGGEVRFSVEGGDGSSFAVAHTAGVAALWIARHGRAELRRRYPGAVQWAFQRAVYASIRVPGEDWDRGRFGEGILDAAALLEQPLPTLEEARPAGARIRTLSGPAARLAPLLPELAEPEIEQRLSELLEVETGELDRALDELAGELTYRLGESEGLRAQIVAGDVAAARERLAEVASERLRARLEGSP